MYKYYSKIFFSKNSPKSFNGALIFPFITTILASMAVIVIFSCMSSLETRIINKIIGVTGYSRIYINLNPDRSFDTQYAKIKQFLDNRNKKVSLSLDRTGVIFYNEIEQIVRVIGVSDFSILHEKLDLKSQNLKNLKNKVLIGSDLAEYLGIDDLGNCEVTILAPIESAVFLKSLNFECADENFEILNINAIDHISQNYVFIDYKDAKKLFSDSGTYLSVNSLLTSQEIQYISDNLSEITYKEWKDFYPVFFSAMKIEKFLYTSFGIILIFVASFNLYGLINLIIYRKRNQLSILMYTGLELREIKKMFINNILIIGFLGSSVGVLISYIMVTSGLLGNLIPMLDRIKIPFLIIPFSIIFNLLTLYVSTYFSMNKNIKNIEVLKSNAITR